MQFLLFLYIDMRASFPNVLKGGKIIENLNWKKLLSRSVEEADALLNISSHREYLDILEGYRGRVSIDGESYSTDALKLLYLEAVEDVCSKAVIDFLASLDNEVGEELFDEVFLGIAENQRKKTRFISAYKKSRQKLKPDKSSAPEVKKLCQYAVEDVLSELGLTVRFNLATKRIEVSGYGSESLYELYSRSNILNVLPTIILDHLRADDYKFLGQGTSLIEQYIFNIADINRYNPILEMLKEYENGDEGNLAVLYALLGIENEFDRLLVKKWLIQCVALAFNDLNNPISSEGVLVLQGVQGSGKTSFFRRLALKPEWFTEGAVIDVRNKDSVISALSTWICELGEIDCTLKREQSALKAFVTRPIDRIRFPYAPAESELARTTSMCGTVNPDKFLNDLTGARRYWVISVDNIDKKYLFSIKDEDIKYLWGYIYRLYKENPEGFRLSDEEREKLDGRNRSFNCELKYEGEVLELLDFTLPPCEWSEVNPARLAGFLPKVEARQIGKILTKISQDNNRVVKKRNNNGVTYIIPLKKCLLKQLNY